MEVVQSIGAPLDAGFREFTFLQFRKWRNMIRAMRTWLREQETSWYREGMHVLVSCWRKAIDVDGDCVEK
jgi:hypothetical protein